MTCHLLTFSLFFWRVIISYTEQKTAKIYTVCVNMCSYITQYPGLMTAQSALHFTSSQTCSIKHHVDFSGKHPAMLQLMHKSLRLIECLCKEVVSSALCSTASWTLCCVRIYIHCYIYIQCIYLGLLLFCVTDYPPLFIVR